MIGITLGSCSKCEVQERLPASEVQPEENGNRKLNSIMKDKKLEYIQVKIGCKPVTSKPEILCLQIMSIMLRLFMEINIGFPKKQLRQQ